MWNVRGLSDSKVELHDLADYFSAFDLVLLTETAVESVPSSLFDGFSVAEIPAEQNGRAGQGLLLAVRNNILYHVEDHTSDSTALWVRLSPSASQAPPFLWACATCPQPDPHSYNSTASLTDWTASPSQCLPAQACQSSCLATSMPTWELPWTAGDGRCSGCAHPPAFTSAQGRLPATRRPPHLGSHQAHPSHPSRPHLGECCSTVNAQQRGSQPTSAGLRPLAFGGAADSGPALPAPAALRWTAHSLQTLAVPGQICILRFACQPASPRQCSTERCSPHHQSAAQPCHGSS